MASGAKSEPLLPEFKTVPVSEENFKKRISANSIEADLLLMILSISLPERVFAVFCIRKFLFWFVKN
jgi:hypothetical protein